MQNHYFGVLERTNKRVHERTNKRVHERTNKRVHERSKECTSAPTECGTTTVLNMHISYLRVKFNFVDLTKSRSLKIARALVRSCIWFSCARVLVRSCTERDCIRAYIYFYMSFSNSTSIFTHFMYWTYLHPTTFIIQSHYLRNSAWKWKFCKNTKYSAKIPEILLN